ncbi:hypothetical protein BH09CHL1_BH09CHL1_21730 [soil metagenome]
MIEKTTAIEHDGRNARRFSALSDQFADRFCANGFGRALAELLDEFFFEIASRNKGGTGQVVDHLRINVRR